MRRKVISLGRSTNVVSIPNSWCIQNKISKGDEIEMHENFNSLVISPMESKTYAKLDVTNMSPMIKRILGSYYKSGFDKITVSFSTKEELYEVEEVIRDEFIGFEIISNSDDEITAKSVSEPNLEEFENMLRRMMLIITSMLESLLLDKLSDSDKDKVILADKDVNKIADYCRRTINKNSLWAISKTLKRNPPLYFIVEQLEKIGDEARDLARCKNIENVSDILKEISIYFNSFYDLFYRFELHKVSSFGEERCRLKKMIDERIKEGYFEELVICRNILEKTFDMNGPLMALKN